MADIVSNPLVVYIIDKELLLLLKSFFSFNM